MAPKIRSAALPGAATVLFLLLSWSDEHFWDEFFYLYSARFHSLSELVRFELVSRLFPVGFFSQKLGHLLLLSGLTAALPGRPASVLIIEAAYALLLLGFFAAAYGCVRELLGPDRARETTLVLAFSPLALYLGFKMLSEVPSLLFVTVGCWAFLRSFRVDSSDRSTVWLVAATLALGLGTLCRITAIVSFGALGIALLLAGREPFERRRLLPRLATVSIGAVALQAGALALAGGSDLRLGSSVRGVLVTHPPVQRLYALAMFVQTFALVLPFAWRRREPGTGLALIWLLVAALPFLYGQEPRYYAPALVPFAMLAAAGFRGLGDLLTRGRVRRAPVLLLAVLVLFDRFLLAPLMPFEVRQNRLLQLFEQVHARNPGATYLLPWASDYSILRVSFPDLPVELCLSRTPESRYMASENSDTIAPMDPADQWWVGRDHYIGASEDLSRRSQPWLYLGWTYNPAALRLISLLGALHLSRAATSGSHSLHSHLAGSWVWYDRSLTLVPVDSLSQYRAYQILQQPRQATQGQ
jgi:dolichyl-phosphate-mannose-protein mannosyltransferase